MTIQERETYWISYWEKNHIFEKSVTSRPEHKQYVFYDGPPFATGLPHYGHILGLTSKDLFPRYWTMKGFRVERRWGWDCHGLPIENIAEKELGIKEKKQIETMGVAVFNEFCRSQVLAFAAEWKKTVQRMGKWIDFDHSYKTMDNSYMESVWHIFKKLYDTKHIYEGKKILLYCPRCETPLASSEIAMDNSYKDVTEKSAIAQFKLKDQKNTYLLAWTTTPWTLIGNVALAVNPDLIYVKIVIGTKNFILAKERLSEVKDNYTTTEEFPGRRLLNLTFEPLYPLPSTHKGYYVIDGGNAVSATDGTGIVHMAIYGEFDYEMIKKYHLPIIQHLDKQGKVVLGPAHFLGLFFKKADAAVLKDLKERGLLFAANPYTHSYPFCYRCETPLFYNAVDSWFVNVQSIKSKLLDRNKEIHWYPEHLKEGRFKYILETAPDWSISRNRFWATAIPVWKCSNCNSVTVIGSVQELRQKAVEKLGEDVDLHKHIVDEFHLQCDKCTGIMQRIPEVLDCWFESGSMPYAAKHYPFESKNWFQDHFPCDFVSEYVAQVRAWFYYTHVLSVLLFDKAPFKNVVVSGNVLAADGSKMSKSKKNFPDPNTIFSKYGADALRFYLMNSPLMRAQDLNFNELGVAEVYRRYLLILSNVKRFYEISCKNYTGDARSADLLDRWITSKLHLLIRDVTNSLDDYDTITACNSILSFVEDLSLWYVRRSRDRFNASGKEKEEAAATLGTVLLTLSKLIAPVTPFIAEELYQTFKTKQESVHLENWPVFDPSLISEQLHAEMQQARVIVSKALEERNKTGIPVRQALSALDVSGVTFSDPDYVSLIKDEVNVKEVRFIKGENLFVKLDTILTPELEREGFFREITRRIQDLRKKTGLQKEDKITLSISSPVDLRSFEQEIKEKCGAVNVAFEKLTRVQYSSKEKIKEQDIEIGFTVV
ncbi:isoleucine--tRNA ligase [Candidatus Woesearchaeota archaeon]|nr:isoleucine--tRNA ligase [Candidatus Woesearchaeota archaeon]